jgi:chromosome partitioning protein
MPVITFANTKGGAGKTTLAVVVACELAQRGYEICLLDGDPQQWASRWSALTRKPKNLKIISEVDEYNLDQHLMKARLAADYTLIDLPGMRSPLLAAALSQTNHVLVPVQGCAMDAVGAAQVINLLQRLRDECEIHIAHSVVLTRVSQIITTRAMTAVRSMLKERNIHVLDTPLIERAAYRDMFINGGTLHCLDEAKVSNLDRARDNAFELAAELEALIPCDMRSGDSAPLQFFKSTYRSLRQALHPA